VPRGHALPHPLGLPFPVVLGGRRAPDVGRIEALGVFVLGHEGAVRRLVSHDEAERLLARLADPLDRLLGDPVGEVALQQLALAVDVEGRVEVVPLAPVAHPVIEAGPRRVVVLAHVPLPDVGRLIAALLEAARVARHRGGIVREVVEDAVRMGVQAAQDRGPAGGAERRGAERVGEADALAREPVHVRRAQERMAHAAHRVPALVVGKDQHHVGTRGSRFRGRRAAARKERQGRPGQPSEHLHSHRRGTPRPGVKNLRSANS
jgi:hypothetical protein